MNLQKELENLSNYLHDKNISEKDVLLLFSNYLLNEIETYKQIDLNNKLIPEKLEQDYTNYLNIKNHLEFSTKSTSLQLGSVIHQLIYVSNQIKLLEEKNYGRES